MSATTTTPSTRSLLRGLTEDQREAYKATRSAMGSYRQVQKRMEQIAICVVSLRLTFEKNGSPDYAGESAQYRLIVGALYEQTIPDEDERRLFKQAIRYWIAKDIRNRVDAGLLDPEALPAARFTQVRNTAVEPDGGADAPLQREMDELLASLSPRKATVTAGHMLAERAGSSSVQTIRAMVEPLDALLATDLEASPSIQRAVRDLLDKVIELAEHVEVNVLEVLARA